jgi:hypothetical protein
MAEIIDVRNSDGYLVVLGSALTLPNASGAPSGVFPPFSGSLRFNPSSGVVEYFASGAWNAFSGGGGGGGGLTSVQLTGDATGTSNSGGTIDVTLVSVGTSGTYNNIVVDAKGRITHARMFNSTDITNALSYTPANISSPTFTGTPTAPTVASTDNSTKIATTAYVQANTYKVVLTSSTTFYVSTSGSDANPGTSSLPYATVTHAYSTMVNKYNINGQNVAIQIEDGTYTENIVLAGVPEGYGQNSITVIGNNGSPKNVFLNSSGNCISIINGATVTVSGVYINSSSGDGIFLQGNATCTFGTVNFGACASYQIQAGGTGSYIVINAPYTISGGGAAHYLCGGSGEIVLYNTANPITITKPSGGTINYSQAFAIAASCGTISVTPGATFSITGGTTVTGTKSNAVFNGVINTNGAGGNTFFPGNVTGTSSLGGQYG